MSEDLIRYEALVLDALRGVVHAVLQRVQKRGVPGEHNFFITFDTCAPGVGMSKRLKDQYPNEMTIVLQHQFWDLVVTEDRFEVRLSFNNVPERLVVPFSAVRIFQDPSVNFALALRPVDGEVTPTPGEPELQLLPAPKLASAPVQQLPKPRKDDSSKQVQNGIETENEGSNRPTADVVSLDKFRKK